MRTLAALVLALSALHAQTASITRYGSSACCGTTTNSTTLPRLGAKVVVSYSGPNFYSDPHGTVALAQPVLAVGVSDQAWSGLALPWLLPTWLTLGKNPNPCWLSVSLDYLEWAPRRDLWSYRTDFDFAVPNNTSLLGCRLFAQCLTYNHQRQSPADPGISYWCSGDALAFTVGR